MSPTPALPAELLRRRRPSLPVAVPMWAGFAGITLLMGALMVPLQLLALPFDRERRVSAWLYRVFWGHALFDVHPCLAMRRLGAEHLGEGPYLVVSNHASVLDIPGAHRLAVPLRVVAKHTLFRIPIIGWIMWLTGPMPLDRSGPQAMRAGLEALREAVDAGSSLLIFPEGTRSPDGTMSDFHKGAFRMAKDLGVPVLPLVQYGAHFMLSTRSLRPGVLHQPVHQVVLPPLDPADFSTARAMTRRVHQQMVETLEELRQREHGRVVQLSRKQGLMKGIPDPETP